MIAVPSALTWYCSPGQAGVARTWGRCCRRASRATVCRRALRGRALERKQARAEPRGGMGRRVSSVPPMSKHVVILGAGFGGLELASRLSETIADAVRVTLIDRSDSFYFGFSKLEVMLGRQSADDVRLHYRDFEKDGVEFRQETVKGVHAAARRVTTDAGSYDADFVVVALGADYDFAATPGFEQGGHEYYSLAGAERLRDALTDFKAGRVLVSVLGQPFKC